MLLTCVTYLLTEKLWYHYMSCFCICICIPQLKETQEKNKYDPLITGYKLHVLTLFTANHVEGINHDGTDIQV